MCLRRLAVLLALLGLTAASALAQPANDDFANAVVIDPATLPATVNGTNVDATGETGDPSGGTGSAVNTVWWEVTPAADGALNVDTFGSDFDTYLAVFTGSSLSTLNSVAQNDDVDAGGVLESEVTFTATSGTTYYIQVDGNGAATGSITLNVAYVPPANDDFANAVVIDATALPATVSGTNVGATGETGETAAEARSTPCGGRSRPQQTAILDVNTSGSDFDTYLSVFTGASVDNLALVAEERRRGRRTDVRGHLQRDGRDDVLHPGGRLRCRHGQHHAQRRLRAAARQRRLRQCGSHRREPRFRRPSAAPTSAATGETGEPVAAAARSQHRVVGGHARGRR